MNDLVEDAPKRKILRLKLEKPPKPPVKDSPPRYTREELSVYMVWCPDGYMPKRVYDATEQSLAMSHAKRLAAETGKRFYVMRSWRGYDAEDAE